MGVRTVVAIVNPAGPTVTVSTKGMANASRGSSPEVTRVSSVVTSAMVDAPGRCRASSAIASLSAPVRSDSDNPGPPPVPAFRVHTVGGPGSKWPNESGTFRPATDISPVSVAVAAASPSAAERPTASDVQDSDEWSGAGALGSSASFTENASPGPSDISNARSGTPKADDNRPCTATSTAVRVTVAPMTVIAPRGLSSRPASSSRADSSGGSPDPGASGRVRARAGDAAITPSSAFWTAAGVIWRSGRGPA